MQVPAHAAALDAKRSGQLVGRLTVHKAAHQRVDRDHIEPLVLSTTRV